MSRSLKPCFERAERRQCLSSCPSVPSYLPFSVLLLSPENELLAFPEDRHPKILEVAAVIPRATTWLAGSFFLLLFASGCGGPADGSAPLSGRVVLRGQPIQVRGRDEGLGWVKLKLLPATAAITDTAKIVEAGISPEGDFQIQKHNGNGQAGLLPGQYRIGLEVENNGQRLLPEHELSRSKLVRELPPPEGKLELDFSTP
jgi:hypothetical protein